MSDFFIASNVVALVLALGAIFFTARIAVALRGLSEELRRFDLSRMESTARSLQEVQLALDELATSVRMSKVRRSALPIAERDRMPDPYKDPDGWRSAMNSKLGRARVPDA